MPFYSPTRKIFSSVNKDLKEIPFDECFLAYREAYLELKDSRQAELDEQYALELKDKEAEYYSNNESAYEGSFSENSARPKAVVSPQLLQQRTAIAIKDKFISKYGVHLHADWILPQIVTLLGNMPTATVEGKISGHKFLENFSTDWLRGIYYFVMINTKSAYLHLQYKAPHKEFGALVPLILYAQKLIKGVPYTAWNRREIKHVVHSDLVDAMLLQPHEFTKAELLKYREEGLTTKSGAKAGQVKNSLTTHKLTGISDANFQQVPPLAQVMLTQIWMAHPDARSRYMVLDPYNWDKMPPAIISLEVVEDSADSPLDVPWSL